MKTSVRKGIGFGLTSGVITTLGLIIGLYSGTHSKFVVLGGILIIAVADALSDALGMHMSEESSRKTKEKDVWKSTFSTFWSKLVFALSFAVFVFAFELNTAVALSIAWGLFLLVIFSWHIAKIRGLKALNVIKEHLSIAMIVIITTYLVGIFVNKFFGNL
jgi:VIT1/CCC1 family predicted Fe2+/Mn2+ transporter